VGNNEIENEIGRREDAYMFPSNSFVFISILEKATGSKVRAEDKS
jgi:hypothetical protein